MTFSTPQFAGPHLPATATPDRAPGSVRRTTSIDCLRPDGLTGDMVFDARARDLVTAAGGRGRAESAHLQVRVEGASRRILSLRASPDEPAWQELVGTSVGPGFRSRLNEAAGHQERPSSLAFLLLDDMVGAGLVSGYALLRGGALSPGRPAGADPKAVAAAMAGRADLCAGWAREGSFMVTIRTRGETPTPLGPPAPTLQRDDDPDSWHPMAPLPPNAVRRRRRIDLAGPAGADAAYPFDVLFRDSHVDEAGDETVVHEYGVAGRVDRSGTLVDIAAEAHVLPWRECPAALDSARRLVGSPVADLRRVVRQDFVGVTTCTHLNDTLRGLSDLGVLLDQLAPAQPAR